jgi:hypothetical protein
VSYRPFSDTLRELRDGLCLDELSLQMQMLVQQVQATNKGGRITLTVDVKPAERIAGAVVITDDIKVKLPEIKSDGTLMWPTPEGNLQRNNPKQRELPGITLANPKESAA